MDEKAIRLISVENAVSIDKNSQEEFFFEFQKSILLTLSEQGVMNATQCRQCTERLAKQFRK